MPSWILCVVCVREWRFVLCCLCVFSIPISFSTFPLPSLNKLHGHCYTYEPVKSLDNYHITFSAIYTLCSVFNMCELRSQIFRCDKYFTWSSLARFSLYKRISVTDFNFLHLLNLGLDFIFVASTTIWDFDPTLYSSQYGLIIQMCNIHSEMILFNRMFSSEFVKLGRYVFMSIRSELTIFFENG